MFQPNLTGRIFSLEGRDVHGRETWGAARDCPFAIVNMDIAAMKTSVRADSSASRGSADQTIAERARILVPAVITPVIGDLFEFDGEIFVIAAVHSRRTTFGRTDHHECDLEIRP